MSGYIVRSACLKLERQFLEHRLLEAHTLYHFTSTLIGWHTVEPLFLAIQHSNARRTINLMTGKGKEVAVHSLHVYCKMRSRLRSVYQYRHAVVVCYADDFIHWIDGSERIADMSNADNLCFVAEELLISLHIELSAVVHRYYLERNATLSSLQLPRHDVGVVLHHRHYHLVTLVHKLLAERRHHKVDALRCAASEDDFFDFGSIDKLADGLTSRLMQVGGTL